MQTVPKEITQQQYEFGLNMVRGDIEKSSGVKAMVLDPNTAYWNEYAKKWTDSNTQMNLIDNPVTGYLGGIYEAGTSAGGYVLAQFPLEVMGLRERALQKPYETYKLEGIKNPFAAGLKETTRMQQDLINKRQATFYGGKLVVEEAGFFVWWGFNYF